MPYGGNPRGPLALQPYPQPDPRWIDDDIEEQFGVFQEVVLAIRSLKKTVGVSDGTKVPVTLAVPNLMSGVVLWTMHDSIVHMANVSDVDHVNDPPYRDPGWERPQGTVVSITPSGVEVYLHVEGVMDVEAEMERLAGRISKAEQERARISSKLENEQFVSKAPPDVVRRERDRLGETDASIEAMSAQRDAISLLRDQRPT